MRKQELLDFVHNRVFFSLGQFESALDNHGKNLLCVSENQDKKYFWSKEDDQKLFEVATNIYHCDDGFVGITGVSDYKGIDSSVTCDFKCRADEFCPIPSTIYVRKSEIEETSLKKLTNITKQRK